MKRSRLIILGWLLFSLAGFAGCSEEEKDGLWPAIQITVNGQKCKDTTYKVSAEGGEYKIYSQNYGSLWINVIHENGNIVWPVEYDSLDYKNINLKSSWYEVQYDNSGNIVVNIQPMEKSATSRSLSFSVECGDAFGSITLLQE